MLRSHLRRISLAGSLATAALGIAPAFADKPAPPPAAAPEVPAGHPSYDTATVETLRGEVVELKRVVPRMPMMAKRFGHGIHAMLKTDKETIEVHLGPEPYVEKQDVKVVVGDRLEVKGSRVVLDGKTVILAEQARKGEKVLTLRDPDGTPKWRGEMGHGGPRR